MKAPLLVIAIGNESRGDDALAPLLLRRLGTLPEVEVQNGYFELLEEFQLQVENTMDMQGRKLVLFIDAGVDTPAPFSFYRIEESKSQNPFSHALAPEVLLALYRQVCHEAPPPAFVLCIRGEQFELGASVSLEAADRMSMALNFIQLLLQHADAGLWDKQAHQLSITDAEEWNLQVGL